MQKVKLFQNGRSQAVRLPAKYRFACDEVYIRQDPNTGDIILSRKPNSWKGFFDLIDEYGTVDDFMDQRDQGVQQERDLF